MSAKWFPSWLQNTEEASSESKKDEIPPELEARFKASEEAHKKEVDSLNERLKGLDSISAYFEEEKKEKEEAKRLAAEAAAAKNKPDSKSPEDYAADLLSDPQKVIKESTAPLADALLQVRADQIRRQVFEDRSSEFEYYAGDIKKEVDSLISGQNLKFQNDPKALENAYHTVLGRKMKEINEGKIKSRFATPSGSSLNKAANSKEDLDFDMTSDMLKAAKLSGMTPEDYKALVKRAAIAGEFEVI